MYGLNPYHEVTDAEPEFIINTDEPDDPILEVRFPNGRKPRKNANQENLSMPKPSQSDSKPKRRPGRPPKNGEPKSASLTLRVSGKAKAWVKTQPEGWLSDWLEKQSEK